MISIIIPVYKVEKYLGECVDSILNQSCRDFELILVDDGGCDNCPQMCDKYAEQDCRIKVIHKQNGGLADARNAGLEIATGEYIIFVDSDDVISENLVGFAYKIIEMTQSDIIQFNYEEFEDGGIIKKGLPTYDFQIIEKENLIESYCKGIVTRTAWNKIYKKELFDNIKYPKGRLAEDLATTYLLIEKCNNIIVCNGTFYYYRIRKESIMTSGSMKLYYDAMLGHKETYEHFSKNKYASLFYASYFKNLLKLYAKIQIEKENNYKTDVEQKINGILFFKLPVLEQILFIIFKIAPQVLLRYIYKRYVAAV